MSTSNFTTQTASSATSLDRSHREQSDESLNDGESHAHLHRLCMTPARTVGVRRVLKASNRDEKMQSGDTGDGGGENDKSSSRRWHLVITALERYKRDGTEKYHAESPSKELNGDLPIHVACRHNPPVDVVRSLIDASPRTVQLTNDAGQLPLHLACWYRVSDDVLTVLVGAYREGKWKRDDRGRTPLHYALDSPMQADSSALTLTSERSHEAPSVATIQLLLDERALVTVDEDGLSPLHILVRLNKRIQIGRDYKEEGLQKVQQILWELLSSYPLPGCDSVWVVDSHHAVEDAGGGPSDFSESQLTDALRLLPKPILELALRHRSVRLWLNQMVARAFSTYFLIMDVFACIVLIFLYMRQVKNSTRGRDTQYYRDTGGGPGKEVYVAVSFIFIFVSYQLARVVIELITTVRAEMKQSSTWGISRGLWAYVKNLWHWFEIVIIGLVYASVSMYLRLITGDDSTVSQTQMWRPFITSVMTIGGLLFIVLLSKLRVVWRDFAVFVSGGMRVLSSLIPFLLCSFLLLASFAYMYWMDGKYNPQCADPEFVLESNVNHCSFSGCLMWTYSRFVGGGTEEEDFEGDRRSLVLTIVFSFFAILLQLNLLIAVVTDAYMHVQNRPDEVFWWHRFAFLTQIEAMRNICVCLPFNRRLASRYRSQAHKWRHSFHKARWNLINAPPKCLLQEDGPRKTFQLYVSRLSNLILISVWLAAGFVTFGWLWPPQVREYLFCPDVEHDDRSIDASIDAKQAHMAHLEKKVDAQSLSFDRLEQRLQGLDSKLEELTKGVDAILAKITASP